MKKIIFTLLLSANLFAFNNVTYFGGVTAEGELTIKSGSLEDKQDQGYNYTLGMELERTFRKNKFVSVGVGAKYEDAFEVNSTKYGKSKFASTVPLYAMGKLILPIDKNSKIYLKGQLGYDFVIEDSYLKTLRKDNPNSTIKVDGGVYSGIGLGIDVNNINMELNYNVSRIKLEYGKDYNYNNAKISATIGYKFDI